MYKGLEHTNKLKREQIVLCRCPQWCDTGYQVAIWTGCKFDYPDAPNDMFHDCVIAFMPLNKDGEPCDLN
ncbi:hypothetical protein DMA11_10250 [Marinilabiliaceae bacterium JC017]|nr:hypothetical protein DMA11_10250 [Marinilabiliaceae bacterium JC017]